MDEPAKKKVGKKKVAKKTAGKSLLERAAAKKRTKAAAETMAPDEVAPSTDKRLDTEVVRAKSGEHPVDTIANARAKDRTKRGTNLASPIDNERAKFRSGPLNEEIINDVCRMLRYSLHREIVERLLGLSRGRIKKWIRRGKESREKIEAWHEAHDDIMQGDQPMTAKLRALGKRPEFDMYALFHACVLEAEAGGEKTAVAAIIDAAAGGFVTRSGDQATTVTAPDWKAQAWLLSRRYNKRWGSGAERQMSEEEDDVNGNEGNRKSAVDRLADSLDEMFGRSRTIPDDEG